VWTSWWRWKIGFSKSSFSRIDRRALEAIDHLHKLFAAALGCDPKLEVCKSHLITLSSGAEIIKHHILVGGDVLVKVG
jgi:hypothetical protein